jgi:hypothetical protein
MLNEVVIEIPEEYRCPITGAIMLHPVSTLNGHTYEREAIEEWLYVKEKDTEPKTGEHIQNRQLLIPNWSIKSLILGFLDKNPQCRDQVYVSKKNQLSVESPDDSGMRQQAEEPPLRLAIDQHQPSVTYHFNNVRTCQIYNYLQGIVSSFGLRS